MRKLKAAMLVGMLFCMQFLWAQTQVSGKVTDARDGNPLPGVTITIKNSNLSTVTGTDGSFSLNAPDGSTLVFSYVGYQGIERPASGTLNVALAPGSNALTEVVVVGYGTRARRDITGSVAKVAARDITNTPATSFETALQGRASGVLVQQQNGKLGQGINIRIRGASSVSAGNEPLYVIDGVPLITANLSGNGAATNALADLNMNDIESIEILKDASAAAIYGSRASNGVVLISTKKGRTGTSKIEFGYFTGTQKPTGRREFLNSQQYIQLFQQAGVGAARQDFQQGYYATLEEAIDDYNAFTESRFSRYSGGNDDWKTGNINTNWQDQVFQNAPISQYDLNVSGGTEKTRFFGSGQYLDQKGILVK
ncbi:MAG TPA: TonB-dependent receptor plug domain-containing protein, partial [Niastella sp.]|nr:TonB-dependent receptor plug domain-containing protein [Niastella sp.]